ncbi:tryptophanyl-tRNA synthetase [Fistulina hepatica ATCC 64428]|uniref:tryptophan--tRNA ligase n=1 Tax=Fistulina hepatica ATCC 64428 TaxID=1128425 RepID=A0A0D7A1G0_9AGAR|nr:tryptophanyl-tRNA synthetase [Fistulina hepatica ATCC 64428]
MSGIQPTGIPHLGNYLGALANWVKLQETAQPHDELLFSIVGWHAMTLPQNPVELAQARRDMFAVLLAIGLDPKRSIIFHQDHNQDHLELAWILDCLTPLGKLQRMTTWKASTFVMSLTNCFEPQSKSRLVASRNANSESEVDESMLNAGLLTYPILQAADILVYRATHVPVGDDQTQHVELCRDLADTFNRTFKAKDRLFPLPSQVKTNSKRILSLKDSSAKMSKSAPDARSRILLTDSGVQISAKIKAAVTDSLSGITYDPVERPGVANLLTILAACMGKEDPQDVVPMFTGQGFPELKAATAEAVEELLKGPRAEFERLHGETAYLEQLAREGAERARVRSRQTMELVKARVGLV